VPADATRILAPGRFFAHSAGPIVRGGLKIPSPRGSAKPLRADRRANRQGWAEEGHFSVNMSKQKFMLDLPCFGGWVGMKEQFMLDSALEPLARC